MRKIFLCLLAAMPYMAAMAQSEWEVPEFEKKTEQSAEKETAVKKKKKAPMIEEKYGVGAVPLVDGKIEWTITIPVNGKTGKEIFEKALETVAEATKAKGQSTRSRITAVNRKENIIAAFFDEEMVFSNSTFAKDFADFRYTLIITCSANEEKVTLCRMSYKYNVGREDEEILGAEETISDDASMNKTRTRFYKTCGKFRKKTIDRKEEIFNMLRAKTLQ